MDFTLNDRQRGRLRGLGIIPENSEEDFFSSLEAHLQESRIWQSGDDRSPTKKNKDHLKLIGKAAKKLELLLDNSEANLLNELSSFEVASKFQPSSTSIRWDRTNASGCVQIIAACAESLNDDAIGAYGSRRSDKAISDLKDYWRDSLKKSPSTNYISDEFVRFTAIILKKSDEASRKAIERFNHKPE
jgi:hypothetical protein